MAIETDVLVVGGGATGAGVARDLALRGVDVTLVERNGLTSGTSGRSHGLLHSGARYAEADRVGAEECITENRILKDIAGACIRDTGGLFVQLAEDDPDYFETKRAACEEVGIPVETLDADEARERVPELAADTERAFEVPDAVIYPSRLVAANAADARDHGADIHPHAPVEGVLVEDGQVAGVQVGGSVGDTIEAGHVINATGAWAGELAAMAGLDVEMQPTRGVMVSVEYDGLGPVLNRCRDPDDGDIVVPHGREVVLGTTSVPVRDPDEYETEQWEIEESIAECAAMLPPVADAPEVRTWWGVRPLYAPDEAERGRGISRGFFLLDHANDGVDNMASIVGGKLTTYRQMAEATADLVCDSLGVDADCRTAERRLPSVDDPEQLDALVAEFDGQGPTDQDVVESA
ncbi:glycerol-3-phosphate dehydrogenase [Haloarcula vallismortis]|uniref:Glycerol-3-phosphate dehydrogenase n=2 Tax=Haloarcula vallismortis TaxID=28442 RepID=M0JV01_HALVA|nr:FAD-dependent oxidoreductase [Haloarcula vallismortis]EMA11475.1 glycerol-3-phosphate dehydrogenase [Haloarcula vallismortis ATCC 29715]SDW42447.1 glycerol-3-phosphate dehydrogenase [Haloarcula vallismortis]